MSAIKPDTSLSSTLWSNIEGILDLEVEERLKKGDCVAQHAAWNYCGWVWYDPDTETWYEEIWRYQSRVETLTGDSATNVIAKALAGYGVV
jgi:hypothetical protein